MKTKSASVDWTNDNIRVYDPTPNRLTWNEIVMVSQKVVTPVKTGVQRVFNLLILLNTGWSLSRT